MRRGETDAGVDGAVFLARLFHRLVLQIVRDDDAGDVALRQRDADGAVDEMPQLLRHHGLMDVLVRDVLEERDEVDLLLIGAADRGARGLADDRHDRLMIELGVIQTVEEMDGARS